MSSLSFLSFVRNRRIRNSCNLVKMNKNGHAAAGDLERVEAAVARLCDKGAGLATFDADGVLWRGDSGNSFLLWQIENHRLTPRGERQAREGWDAYLRGQLSELELALLCGTCMDGLREEEVAADAAALFAREFRASILAPVQSWALRLQEAGVEVWMVSGSHRWLVEAGAQALGLRADRVLPVRPTVRDGRLTAEIPEPVTFEAGKAEAIRRRLGRLPQLAAGNTFADRHMLELAEVAVAVEPDPELEELARARDWPVVRFR